MRSLLNLDEKDLKSAWSRVRLLRRCCRGASRCRLDEQRVAPLPGLGRIAASWVGVGLQSKQQWATATALPACWVDGLCLLRTLPQAASAQKQGGDKDARLQYLSWRIWHMKRKHAMVQHARRLVGGGDDSPGGRTQAAPRCACTPGLRLPHGAASCTLRSIALPSLQDWAASRPQAEQAGAECSPLPPALPPHAAGRGSRGGVSGHHRGHLGVQQRGG